ncbi:hypothetical protein JXE04_01475 [Patescibacteria group bacterium]|nr:hypothetical protein [Patescibacteria group bacterium]
MNLNYGKDNQKNTPLKTGSVGLYLKVHVMPKLNMPLRGKPWHWIMPVVLLALSVVAFFYFFAN